MRDSSTHFPHVDEPASVTTARLWHCKFRTVAPLGDLHLLEGLDVATFHDASLTPLERLTRLRYLRLVHLPEVSDLGPLGCLQNLEVLHLSTLPSWDASGKTTEIESLARLARMPALRHLELFGVHPPDRSLSALEPCVSLVSVRVSGYPLHEVERFRRATGLDNAFAPHPWF